MLQGCPLSPMLFNLYSERTMRHALEKWEDGMEIGGKFYNNLRYADDVALLATTEGKLQELVNYVGKASTRFWPIIERQEDSSHRSTHI